MVTKFRRGFVSNSSSTAFVCELSNQIISSENFDDKIFCGTCGKIMAKSSLKEWIGRKYNKVERVFVYAELAMARTGEQNISEEDALEEFRLFQEIPPQLTSKYCPFCSGDKVGFYERYLYLLGKSKEKDIDAEFLAKNSKRVSMKTFIAEEYIWKQQLEQDL